MDNMYVTEKIGEYIKKSDLRTDTDVLLDFGIHTKNFYCDAIEFSSEYDIDNILSIEIEIPIDSAISSSGHYQFMDKYRYAIPFTLFNKLCPILPKHSPTSPQFIRLPPEIFYGFEYLTKDSDRCRRHTSICIRSSVPMKYDLIFVHELIRDNTPHTKENFFIRHIISKELQNNTKIELNTETFYGVSNGFFLETQQLPTKITLSANCNLLKTYDSSEIEYNSSVVNTDGLTKKHTKVLRKCLFNRGWDEFLINKLLEYCIPTYVYWFPFFPHEDWKNMKSKSFLNFNKFHYSDIKIEGCSGNIHFMVHTLLSKENEYFHLYQ